MPENEIIHKLAHYYHIHRPDVIDPQVSLDWVNTNSWESEIYAFTLTSGGAQQRRSEQRVLRLLSGATSTVRGTFGVADGVGVAAGVRVGGGVGSAWGAELKSVQAKLAARRKSKESTNRASFLFIGIDPFCCKGEVQPQIQLVGGKG